jgi:hypothetical protein
MRVGRAFLKSFIGCPFYVVTIAIVDSYETLEMQNRTESGARSKYRTYSTMEEIDCWEPSVSNAIVEGVVIRAARRHNPLWANTVVLR